MPPITRLTSALAGRNALAAAVAVAGVLGGAGTASAATIAGAGSATHEAAHHVAKHTRVAHGKKAHAKVATEARNSAHAKAAAPAHSAQTVKPAPAAKPAPAHSVPAAKPAPAHSVPAAKPAPAHSAPAAKPAPAHSAPAAATPAPKPAAAPAPSAQPYQVYDSVTPSAIPSGARIATYATGGYAVNSAAVASRSHVTWIDTNASDPHAAALDVEPGDATPGQAAQWTWQKLHKAASDIAIIYTMRSEWPATQAAINTLPTAMQHQVRYWIADPTGVPHIVPGASATQWYWGQSYDISTAAPGSGL